MRTITPGQVNRLRREASRLKKEKGIKHSRALDEIAVSQGWKNWGELVAAEQPPNSDEDRVETEAESRERYFVHGDQGEEDPALYYCEFCERFERQEHFELTHSQDDGRQVIASLEGWRKLPLATKSRFKRPNSAPNLFQSRYPPSGGPSQARTTLAEPDTGQARARRTAKSGLFHTWLVEQEWRPDAVGELARRVAVDGDYPVESDSLQTIQEHLRGAAPEELQAFEEAWEDFLESVR